MKSSIVVVTLAMFVASSNAARCWTAGASQNGCSGTQYWSNFCAATTDDPGAARGPPNNNCEYKDYFAGIGKLYCVRATNFLNKHLLTMNKCTKSI
ncbi:hypothetical protein COCCADRAFT_113411 [Bipolaris zeicola 26-R-13]|uniref:Secreted protein n=1 Tax=Cochliobolus carbonum (strain 26-R-13) TaxID=930089 RepID=W6XNF1_COCC2|nr:uncharacterized protein COCCADRAFT_113411 [Bipolaris zeicola 26-R-13]EUC26775.1 hypothetical protein COCCADRAFT_113411 [Bipolaris zeicola 26-R-13]